MAKTNTSLRIKTAGNPFTKDKTLAAMKKRWSEMTPAQRESNVENFKSAAKGKPKGGATSTKPPTSKTTRPNQTVNGASLGSKLTKEEQKKRKQAASPAGVKKDEKKPAPAKPAKKVYPSGRVELAARQAERNRNRGSDPKNETRTRFVRVAGGGTKKVYEIKRNGKWVKAGGKG